MAAQSGHQHLVGMATQSGHHHLPTTSVKILWVLRFTSSLPSFPTALTIPTVTKHLHNGDPVRSPFSPPTPMGSPQVHHSVAIIQQQQFPLQNDGMLLPFSSLTSAANNGICSCLITAQFQLFLLHPHLQMLLAAPYSPNFSTMATQFRHLAHWTQLSAWHAPARSPATYPLDSQ
jgi:hypothetical protein